jgi:hypothetical protein
VDRVGAIHATAAGVTPGDRIEVDERFADGREPTTAGGTGDRSPLTVADRDRAELGI